MKRKARPFYCYVSNVMAYVLATSVPGQRPASAMWLAPEAQVASRAGSQVYPADSHIPARLSARDNRSNAHAPSPSDAEISGGRIFSEPLIPLNGQSNPAENTVLYTSLKSYSKRAEADDCSALVGFVREFPQSRWTGPVWLNLGTEYYNYGYYSKALDAWEHAWALCQEVTSGPAKAEADRALGELARMYSKVGRVSDLQDLLQANQARPVQGPATQLIEAAESALWMMQNQPEYSFGCGPGALDRILLRTDPTKAGNPLLLECKSSTNGFSLAEVANIARRLGMQYQTAVRQPGAEIVLPAVVHWKVGHYAALVERRGDQILAQDYTFRGSVWMTPRALEDEASGYFLVPKGPLPNGWRTASDSEAKMISGKGFVTGQDGDATSGRDAAVGGSSCTKCKSGCGGMAGYSMHAMLASLTLEDTPVGYTPPVGPAVQFTATYHQKEANQPATFAYSNLGPKWTFNWLSYVTDNPTSTNADVALYADGGGTFRFNNFDPHTQSFAGELMSHALLVRTSPSSYALHFPDGSLRTFAQSDGSVGSTRRVFLTQVSDPAGNAVRLNYDSQLRLTSLVDAIGQTTTLLYTNTAFPFLVTGVSDPFGRSAEFVYTSDGLLAQITDVIGLTSKFSYGTRDFITTLTTPYGVTTFDNGGVTGGSYLTATDPEGGTELLIFAQGFFTGVPDVLPASEVPHGLSTFNLFIDGRNSLFWDKKAYAEGAVTFPGNRDYDWTTAKIFHWLHQTPTGSDAARILESQKEPLESRVWYNYPGQPTNLGAPYYLDAAFTGASSNPSVVARVLDDGSTQLSAYTYNALGNLTTSADPLGRSLSYTYASNKVDLLEVRMTSHGKNELLTRATYNQQHQPLTVTDAAGQSTTFSYNARGQVLTVSNPKSEVLTFNYDPNGFLLSSDGPLPGTNDTVRFSYDSVGRVHTATDTEGYTATYAYDDFDRTTSIAYPDGTSQRFVYDRLDLVAAQDRLGRWTTNSYNANRQLVSVQDPLGRLTQYQRCKCGLLEAIIDPMGRATRWSYDVQSRPATKQYADGSAETYLYEDSTSRLRGRLDPGGQETDFHYYSDDTLKSVSYPNAVNPTPAVIYTYDPDYRRISTMQDGIGTTVYSYFPITTIPRLGARQLASLSGPVPKSVVTYQYDELGRIVSRAINGIAQASTYDPLNRVTQVTNALGQFSYSYVGATARLGSAAYPNGQSTLYSYYDNLGDQRLQEIKHLKPDGSLLSSFGYAYNTAGQITTWTNQWDILPSRTWLLDYDAADQLISAVRTDGVTPVTSYRYAYDAAGNRILAAINAVTNLFTYNALNQLVSGDIGLTNDVTYEWDAAKRLAAINQDTRRTEFSYDALGRRARIVEMQGGTVLSDNYFIWCGTQLCEQRDSSNATVIKRFFFEGESLGGTETASLFYTRDHLASVREALDSTGKLTTRYDYDPYGKPSALVEDFATAFSYSGQFQHKASGLNFGLYRGFDPKTGRWLNRDPIAESGGLNLYAYVSNNPINATDPIGEGFFIPFLIIGAAAALIYAAIKYFKGSAERVDQASENTKRRHDFLNNLADERSNAGNSEAEALNAQAGEILKEQGGEANEFSLHERVGKAVECPIAGK